MCSISFIISLTTVITPVVHANRRYKRDFNLYAGTLTLYQESTANTLKRVLAVVSRSEHNSYVSKEIVSVITMLISVVISAIIIYCANLFSTTNDIHSCESLQRFTILAPYRRRP